MEMSGVTNTQQGASDSTRKGRRNRIRLNCGECRSKKLSCDRNLPCQRCVRSGKPELCSFGPGTRQPPPPAQANSDSTQALLEQNAQKIQELRDEVFQLRALLGERKVSPVVPEPNQTRYGSGFQSQRALPRPENEPTGGITDLKDRSPRVYYRQHVLMRFPYEMPQIFPLIKEMFHEFVRPRGITIKKLKPPRNDYQVDSIHTFLPSKADVDVLVSFYIEHLECIHRVVHIPTFWAEYAAFWHEPDDSAMAAMVLPMISITTACVTAEASESTHAVALKHQSMPPRWICACDGWIRRQGSKCRRIPYYQVSCLLYLAKRTNLIRKKRFWNETGALVQQVVSDGVHLAPPDTDTIYTGQMKSRIWATLRELDLQNASEYGLPVLVHILETDIAAPANVDDEGFDPPSESIAAKPLTQYTRSSFQAVSDRSWNLRLEVSRRLFSTGTPRTLPYDEVLKYTSDINQALDSLPSWVPQSDRVVLTSAYLSFSLWESLLALHRPYLPPGGASASLSGTICSHVARDVLVANAELKTRGIQSLTVLREDLLVAALTLTRIALQQPRSPIALPRTGGAVDSETALALLEGCLPLAEDRYLRAYYGEPWTPVTVLGAIMMLKVHFGKEAREAAKRAGAERFLEAYYRHPARRSLSREEVTDRGQDEGQGLDAVGDFGISFFDWDADAGGEEGSAGYWVPPWY